MPCFYCMQQQVWICDPDALGPYVCDGADNAQPNWTPAGEHTIDTEGIYKVWCRRGDGGPCGAAIQEDSPGAQWSLAGAIKFEPGTYDLWCRPGGQGGKCQVKVEKK